MTPKRFIWQLRAQGLNYAQSKDLFNLEYPELDFEAEALKIDEGL